MKEGLYIDVVSKTIISELAESIARFVGDSVFEEIKKVLLTDLPGLIRDEIDPAFGKARKDAQEANKASEKKVFKQLKDIKGHVDKHFLSNGRKTDKTLKDLKSFIETGFMRLQDTLDGSLEEKRGDFHDKIINSIQELLQDAHEKKVEIEGLQSESRKVIDALEARIRDLENEKIELDSALNESIASAENLRVFSQKESDEMKARIDGLENERVDQDRYIARHLPDLDSLRDQLVTLEQELTRGESIAEDAVKEKGAIEKKLAAIQELWEKQQMPQETP